MAASSSLPAQFLADLDVVCPTAENRELSAAFMDDLDLAFTHAQFSVPAVPDVSSSDLAQLADELLTWRAGYQATLKRLLHDLPADDPLLSPVSLFGTMDYGRLETAHTRTLAWLLDDREHGFGFRLLEALLQHLRSRIRTHVLRGSVASEVLVGSYGIGVEGGRIDILAKGTWEEAGQETAFRLAIEAKSDADESDEQLSGYEHWLARDWNDAEEFRVFVTPKGRESQTGTIEWTPLSFLDLAGVFRHVDGLNEKPGYHFLRYYLTGVLREVCGLPIPITPDCPNPYTAVDYWNLVLAKSQAEDGDGPTR